MLLIVIGLLGDRLKKAPGGWEFYSQRVSGKVLARWPPPQPITGEGAVAVGTRLGGTGTVSGSADAMLGPIHDVVTASVFRGGSFTAAAVIAAADAMEHAATPEELAERVVDYVNLRGVPGMRALSAERIRLEQDLFGAILELQTLRSRGARPRDTRQMDKVLDRIEAFWSTPENLSDEAVADSTVAVREVLKTIVELPVPDSFRLLGMKARLAGDDNPCPVCGPLRGNLYDPHDPDAPRLPISGCEQVRGCTCRYT